MLPGGHYGKDGWRILCCGLTLTRVHMRSEGEESLSQKASGIWEDLSEHPRGSGAQAQVQAPTSNLLHCVCLLSGYTGLRIGGRVARGGEQGQGPVGYLLLPCGFQAFNSSVLRLQSDCLHLLSHLSGPQTLGLCIGEDWPCLCNISL